MKIQVGFTACMGINYRAADRVQPAVIRARARRYISLPGSKVQN